MDDPFSGGGCARRLGQPQTIRQLASAYLETGNGLDQLVEELRRSVGSVLPADWRGETAAAVPPHAATEPDSATQSAARAHKIAEAAVTLAEKLDAALAMYAEAQTIALVAGYYIGENCWIYPRPGIPTSALDVNGGFEAEMKLRQALAEADVA